MNARVQLCLPFTLSWTLVYETEPHSVHAGFPIPIKLNSIIPHRHAQGLILWILLEPISLAPLTVMASVNSQSNMLRVHGLPLLLSSILLHDEHLHTFSQEPCTVGSIALILQTRFWRQNVQ